jgi:hypothetical protein
MPERSLRVAPATGGTGQPPRPRVETEVQETDACWAASPLRWERAGGRERRQQRGAGRPVLYGLSEGEDSEFCLCIVASVAR